MNTVIKIALLIFFAAGTAAAGSFEFHSVPPAALDQAIALPVSNPYLKVSDIHTFAAAHRFDIEGYIGTIHLQDTSILNLSTTPSEVVAPEPATIILLTSGLAIATFRKRRLRMVL
jgi:hypothetical protein